jgi:hypothetical protein
MKLDYWESRKRGMEKIFDEMQEKNEKIRCMCGNLFDPEEEGGMLSADPYGLPFCGECVQKYIDEHGGDG